ncbi:MAG: toll/interleukin-1 receptor domain-containing protein [Chloroflexi bacterium]|nr:toll/interleukin-1 receptor domain-containing protein [Chloroflexota bacterium]
MTSIFISYARKNQRFALFLQELLETNGYRVWIDVANIPGGQEWAREIETAIQEAHAVAVIVTPEAAQSEWVNREIELAIAHEKRIVPIMLEGELPGNLSKYQWVDVGRLIAELEKAFPPRTADTLIADLKRQLEDQNPAVRLGAIAMVEAVIESKGAVPRNLLLERLGDSSAQVRAEAARALGGLRADWALDHLIKCLEDEHHDVRSWSAWALGKIGDKRALPHLLALQEREASSEVLHWVRLALDQLAAARK